MSPKCMMEPLAGKVFPAKHATLSTTQSKALNVRTRLEAMRSPTTSGSPVRKMIPVEALCPTVGANCRGVEHGSAIGDGKEGTLGCIRWLTQRVGHGELLTQRRTQVQGPLGEVTPLLLQDELYVRVD